MNHRSYLLELSCADDFCPKAFAEPGVSIIQAGAGDAHLCRRLWSEVGRGFWTERGDWPPEQWRHHLSEPAVSFWVARKHAEEIGFFELLLHDKAMKIEGFGLLAPWRNRGLGGGLLSAATQQAFELGATRIWLHTATDDHPNALPNYQKRGYRIYREADLKNPMARPSATPGMTA